MEEKIKKRLIEISNNYNGNHKRSIRDLKKLTKDIEEVIENLEDMKKHEKRNKIIKYCFVGLLIFVVLTGVYASINYKINGTTKFSVGENETLVTNILRGIDQILLEESISFRTLDTNEEIFALYRANSNQSFSNVSSDFDGALVHQMSKATNINNIEEIWWDKENQLIHFAINHGAIGKATTFRRSLQIVGNITNKENDGNFTLCEGVNYIDCDTDLTGADLFVQDDLETGGSIYSNENIYANENLVAIKNIYALSIGDSGSYITELFSTQINADTINLTTIYADLVSASNISTTNIYADRIDVTCICYDGGCLGSCA